MLRTVKEVSDLSGVTVKTLHHYHKIGLLAPSEVREPSGYRYYGTKELERLQQILFYRELDVPLAKIKRLLDGNPERMAILTEQRALLMERRERLERIIRTLEDTVDHEKRGDSMDQEKMFAGFGSEAEWREALRGQDEHLKTTYGFDPGEEQAAIDVASLNEQAAEAARFMGFMADALRAGARHDGSEVQGEIARHLEAQRKHGHDTNAETFALQCRFFLGDDFHRGMLESQQVGLAYYLCAAADAGNAR